MKRLAIVIVLLAACKKQERAPIKQQEGPPPMPAAEIQRSQDACKQYVEHVCACAATVPAAAEPCKLASALPEAVRIGLEVAASPDSGPDLIQQSYTSIRKTAKECIEQTAKLPALGCP